jgi:anti-sigma factor RsiW
MINEPNRPTSECEEVLPLLSEYLDAELPGDMCVRIADHLRTCEACASFIESLRASIALCRKVEHEFVPSPLPETVRSHLRQTYEAAIRTLGHDGKTKE